MNKFEKHNKGGRGFTIVELSIAVILIGVFLTMIVKGTELIQSTRFTKTFATANDITTAAMAFKQKYDVLPGDMMNAMTRIPGCDGTCQGGNNDGVVGIRLNRGLISQAGTTAPQIETSLFWKHLSKADLVTGVDPTANIAAPAMDRTHPRTPMGGVFSVYHNTGSTHGLAIVFTPDGYEGFLTPAKAMLFDLKVDGEPDPSKGQVLSNGGPGCSMATNTYANDDSLAYCYMLLNLNF